MDKAKTIFFIVLFVVLAYVLMMIFQPVTNSFVQSVNTTIDASSNWSNYSETQGLLVGWPFWQWFLPGTIGTAAVIITLKRK